MSFLFRTLFGKDHEKQVHDHGQMLPASGAANGVGGDVEAASSQHEKPAEIVPLEQPEALRGPLLTVGDVLAHLPVESLNLISQPGFAQPLDISLEVLEKTLRSGHAAVPLVEVYKACPGLFQGPIEDTDDRLVPLPPEKIVSLLGVVGAPKSKSPVAPITSPLPPKPLAPVALPPVKQVAAPLAPPKTLVNPLAGMAAPEALPSAKAQASPSLGLDASGGLDALKSSPFTPVSLEELKAASAAQAANVKGVNPFARISALASTRPERSKLSHKGTNGESTAQDDVEHGRDGGVKPVSSQALSDALHAEPGKLSENFPLAEDFDPFADLPALPDWTDANGAADAANRAAFDFPPLDAEPEPFLKIGETEPPLTTGEKASGPAIQDSEPESRQADPAKASEPPVDGFAVKGAEDAAAISDQAQAANPVADVSEAPATVAAAPAALVEPALAASALLVELPQPAEVIDFSNSEHSPMSSEQPLSLTVQPVSQGKLSKHGRLLLRFLLGVHEDLDVQGTVAKMASMPGVLALVCLNESGVQAAAGDGSPEALRFLDHAAGVHAHLLPVAALTGADASEAFSLRGDKVIVTFSVQGSVSLGMLHRVGIEETDLVGKLTLLAPQVASMLAT